MFKWLQSGDKVVTGGYNVHFQLVSYLFAYLIVKVITCNKNNLFMAAPAGNRFWELRSKHGRDKLFTEPKLLWKAAVEYFTWCEQNPLYETDFRGKDATEVLIPKMRAFTISGLCLFLDVSQDFMHQFKDACAGRIDEESKDFSRVISTIYDTIYTQKFTGAAAGFLNPNIIARDLGLTDKQEIKQLNQNINVDFVDYTELSDEALKEIKNAGETKRLES